MNKEDISWVVGEAIHFAYEVGYLDCELKRGYSTLKEITILQSKLQKQQIFMMPWKQQKIIAVTIMGHVRLQGWRKLEND